jgi:hypothetical protein
MQGEADEELVEPRPVVINETLLLRGAREGLTEAERERFGPNANPSPPDVTVLRLTYMFIRKIDNLQCYTALQELYLANNLITTIENLQTLVTLRKLDLSFNQISEFEGLQTLVNLEEISLFKNRVTKLENFPILPKLRLLSLGRNKIADLQEVAHLYKLKTLRVLTLIANPIHEKDIFKLTVLAYLPGLHFLDYARVTSSDITDAKERHSDQLNSLQQQDYIERQQQESDKNAEMAAKLNRDAFLNKIADLHVSLFKKDNDHHKLRTINEIAQPYMRFVDELHKAVDSFLGEMKTQFRLLNEEEELFQQAYHKVTEDSRLDMIKIVKDLERKRRAFMSSLNTEEEQANEGQNDDAESRKFLELIDDVKDDLFTKEFALVDMVSEMIRTYEGVLFDDMLGIINERISSFFNIVRMTETDYNEKVTDICMKLWERFNQGEAVEVTDEIRSILVDKDTLLSTITQSHEHRTTKLYRRQEDISSMYKGKIELMASSSRQTDLERNRKRISEISNYISSITRAIQAIDGGDDEPD